MAREMSVSGVLIADDLPCYTIAEIGHNHQGNVDTCKMLFDAAKQCGASSVKLQKRNNHSLFTRDMYDSRYDSENAYADTYGAHREALEFGADEYKELQAYAKKIGIIFFSTAFDIPSADFLADLDMPAYKIASGDLINTPLLRHVASIGKPMFVSTGAGTMEDIRRAYDTIMPINEQLCIMQCTAGYPPEWEQLNLRVIETLRAEFPDIVVGFSSHDSGIAMALVGYVLGARAIEKHFTLNRTMKGTDHAFSLESPGLRRLVRDLDRARLSLGDGQKRRYESEEKPLFKMSKKLVAATNLAAGTIIETDHIAIKSPNDGLPPYMYTDFLGRKLIKDLQEDENLMLEHTVDGP